MIVSHGRPKKGPTALRRAAKKARQSKDDRLVYAVVDRRDGLQSRMSRIYGGQSIHRHHVKARSLGGATTTANVISLTDREHLDVHATLIDIRFRDESLGADGEVDFYRRRHQAAEWEFVATS